MCIHRLASMLMFDLQTDGARMLREEVTEVDIADIVAKWTGIPVSKLVASEREKLLHLNDVLHQRVVGQDEAVEAVADAIQRWDLNQQCRLATQCGLALCLSSETRSTHCQAPSVRRAGASSAIAGNVVRDPHLTGCPAGRAPG